ncbi:MAG: alpha/beta fold hydrolase [Lapillicoccus sp.]
MTPPRRVHPGDIASADTTIADDAGDSAGALDLMLSDAALGTWRRFVPGLAVVRLAASLSKRPDTVLRAGVGLALELARIGAKHSDLAAAPKDRRFKDSAWTDNSALHGILQGYLAGSASARSLLSNPIDAMPWRDRERLTFLLDNILDASAPSNVPLLNPLAWKALRETKGRSAVSGLRNFVVDMSTSPRVPTMVDPEAFEVGRDLALTPGAVVHRTPVFELIHYAPTTPTVHRVPLLIIPPVINKYYIVDLAPGRSMVEYFLSQGQQVLTISWRNPDARHRDWGIDAYAAAILEAVDATRAITRSKTVHLQSFCSGGILSAMLAGHLAATGRLGELASFNLCVAVLDQRRAGLPSALLDEATAKAAVLASSAKGYLDGRALAEIFAWLRPNDLIWNYWVNNYLLGRKPPAFDVLAWNADTTRMTAALHEGFIEMAVANSLVEPGSVSALGSAVDLRTVDVDSYILAGIADHICPWQSCYRSTQLLGGRSRFVLSTSGHIASLVNPPGNPKASFLTNETNGPDPQQWLEGSTPTLGSWWPDFVGWLAERSGGRKRAPRSLGRPAAGYAPMEAAPGTYVFDA